MKEDILIQDDVVIPGHEVTVTASRAGGPGGQHVNKASTRITVRWNVQQTRALTDEQKNLVTKNLAHELTKEGEIIVHSSESRSQQHNKKAALDILVRKIRKALIVPKKRKKTKVPKEKKEKRLQEKKKRGEIKKMRGKVKID